jgi:hypothetical protein
MLSDELKAARFSFIIPHSSFIISGGVSKVGSRERRRAGSW